MKILVINSLDARYGSTYRIRALRNLLWGQGFDVEYVERLRNPWSKLRTACQSALSTDYDLLFTQKFNPITIAALALTRLRGKPTIVDWDDIDAGLQGNWPKKILAATCEWIGPHFATRITTHSEKIRARAERIRPTDLVPQGFDGNLFHPSPEDRSTHRRQFGFQADDMIVGHMCTFTTGGTLDIDVILESWTEPPLSKAKFFLIGGGPTDLGIRRKVKALGLEDRVTWSGLLPHEEIPKALNALDASVVFMSDRPANLARVSFKVIESLAMNVPVVGQVVGETGFRFGHLIHAATRENLAEVTAQVAGEEIRRETSKSVEPYEWKNAATDFVVTVRGTLRGRST